MGLLFPLDSLVNNRRGTILGRILRAAYPASARGIRHNRWSIYGLWVHFSPIIRILRDLVSSSGLEHPSLVNHIYRLRLTSSCLDSHAVPLRSITTPSTTANRTKAAGRVVQSVKPDQHGKFPLRVSRISHTDELNVLDCSRSILLLIPRSTRSSRT